MPPPLLSMQSISKTFGGIAALTEASLEVEAGEVHALIGQNGAGKSTLIKVLTGYHRKTSGEVMFEGRPFEATSPRAAQDAGISTIYQEINLVPQRSVAENICLGREMRRFGLLDWAAMRAEARRLLARFNLDIDVDQPLARLAFILFDPRSDDGFMFWNILDPVLGMTPAPAYYPVLRSMSAIGN